MWAIIQKTFNVLKPFCQPLSHKKWEGAFIRQAVFIRINMVCKLFILIIKVHPVPEDH